MTRFAISRAPMFFSRDKLEIQKSRRSYASLRMISRNHDNPLITLDYVKYAITVR